MLKPTYNKWTTEDKKMAFNIDIPNCLKCGEPGNINRGRYHGFIDYFSFICPVCGEYTIRDIYKENKKYVVIDMVFD